LCDTLKLYRVLSALSVQSVDRVRATPYTPGRTISDEVDCMRASCKRRLVLSQCEYRRQARSNVVIGKLRDYFPTALSSSGWFSRINKRGVIIVPGFFNTFVSLESVFISHSDQNVLSLGHTGQWPVAWNL